MYSYSITVTFIVTLNLVNTSTDTTAKWSMNHESALSTLRAMRMDKEIKRWFASVTQNDVSAEKQALLMTRSWAEERGGNYRSDQSFVLTRSSCLGLHTRLGSDFFPNDNDSDNDCWWKRNKRWWTGQTRTSKPLNGSYFQNFRYIFF